MEVIIGFLVGMLMGMIIGNFVRCKLNKKNK
jgi:uncharacterized protein YneF (UPF0154 family)